MTGKASNVALTHSNGSFSCARLASNQYCPASNVTIFDHLQNDPCCPTGGQLTNHPLGHLPENRNRYPSSQIQHTLMHICTLFYTETQYSSCIYNIPANNHILSNSNIV